MKTFIIFLIVYTAICCKCSCTSIQSELEVINGSNITSDQKGVQHSSLISRMKESIDSEYPQVIIYIPTNEEPLEVKQSPLKHIRNLLLSFFDRLIKKEIDFDDDYSILNEVKRLNKVEVVPQNDTDEETSNIWKEDIEVFSPNFDSNPLDENDVLVDIQNNKCISCQNTKPYNNNNHSCNRTSTTNTVEKKRHDKDNSKEVPSNLPEIISKMFPGVIIKGKDLIEPPEMKILVKREKVVPKSGTFTSSQKFTTADASKQQSKKKIMQSTERFATEFIDKNTKYYVGETTDVNEDSTINKFEKVDDNKRINTKNKKSSIEEKKPSTKAAEQKDFTVEPSSQAVNISPKSNSTNKFLETHHFLLNSGGTVNQSATASVVKNKINLKFNIRKTLTNVKTKRNFAFNRSKRTSNENKTEVDEHNYKHVELINSEDNRESSGSRISINVRDDNSTTSSTVSSDSTTLSTTSDVDSNSTTLSTTSAVDSNSTTLSTTSGVDSNSTTLSTANSEPNEGNNATSASIQASTSSEQVITEIDESDNAKGLSQKPLLMIITVPTFFGIGAMILLLCFITRDGGWCCKLFNIQYYKDQEVNNA